ncbi:MAG: hypothetical protein HYY96_02270 [Candidatus Tectomicrobia bacterium]|nr:hypothetical protein [Candidatus Tectomicrobia bacterium]
MPGASEVTFRLGRAIAFVGIAFYAFVVVALNVFYFLDYKNQKVVLRVALYPYIPDSDSDNYEKLRSTIIDEFNSTHPSIRLDLRPIKPNEDYHYDLNKLAQWLTTRPENGGYDVVEVDTMLLGELYKRNIIAPWEAPGLDQTDWYQAGRSASIINGRLYGVPHWLCGYFILARDEKVAKAQSLDILIDTLQLNTKDIPNLAGNMVGQWRLPTLYVKAWSDADESRTENIDSAIRAILRRRSAPYVRNVLLSLRKFASQCRKHPEEPSQCLDGSFEEEPYKAESKFADHKVKAIFGYFESLHNVKKHNNVKKDTAEPIYIAPLPLGERNSHVFMVDAFVLNRKCGDKCQKAAVAFVKYIHAEETYEWIVMGKKGTSTVPRYLIPATKSAFTVDRIIEDKHYEAIKSIVKGAREYPRWYSEFNGVDRILLEELEDGVRPVSTGGRSDLESIIDP